MALLPNARGKERIDLKNRIAIRLTYQSPAESEAMMSEALVEAEEIDYKKGIAMATLVRGTLFSNSGDYANGKETLQKAVKLARQADDNETVAYAQLGLGALHIRSGELALAFENHIGGLEAARVQGITDLETTCLMNMGIIKQMLEDFDEAFEFLEAALELAKKNNLTLRLGQIHTNLGVVEVKRNNYGSAIGYHKEALAVFQSIRLQSQLVIAHLNIGFAYTMLGNYKEALKAYSASMDINMQLGDSLGIAKTYRYKGELMAEKGDVTAAHLDYQNGLRIARRLNNDQLKSEIYFLEFQLYEKQNDASNALESYKAYIEVRDSLTSKENELKIAQLTSQFEFDQLENENLLRSRENEIKDLRIRQRNYLLAGLIVILILVIFWSLWKRKNLLGQLALSKKDIIIAQKEAELRVREFEAEKLKLVDYANQLISKNQELEGKKSELESQNSDNQEDQKEISELIDKLKATIHDEKDWTTFRLYFDAVFPRFFAELKARKDVELTMYEQRLLALLKISLSNKEIGEILNISRNSVVRAKYRLRQKFDLPEAGDLEELVGQI